MSYNIYEPAEWSNKYSIHDAINPSPHKSYLDHLNY